MNKQKINIWGREVELEVVYDRYEGEDVLSTQQEALAEFLSNAKQLTDGSKKPVEEYCIKRDADEIGPLPIENIFKFVMPKSLYIQRTTNGTHVVGLMCAYRFNPEDGIAIVFTDGKLDRVGSQNTIL